jgi:hypothetical protein
VRENGHASSLGHERGGTPCGLSVGFGDYGIVAAGAALLDSDFDSLLAGDESLELGELSDEAEALEPFSLVADSDFTPSVFESADSDAALFGPVLFL